jgi:hypothetical protein
VREAVVRAVPEESVVIEYVELVFKDQYLSRCDMIRMREALVGHCLHRGKKLHHLGIRAQVNHLFYQNRVVWSGLVTQRTKVFFRSRAARMFVLIQVRPPWVCQL